MRTKTIFNTKEYKVLMLRKFHDFCEGCKRHNHRCVRGMCLFKAQRSWKKYRGQQWKLEGKQRRY